MDKKTADAPNHSYIYIYRLHDPKIKIRKKEKTQEHGPNNRNEQDPWAEGENTRPNRILFLLFMIAVSQHSTYQLVQ